MAQHARRRRRRRRLEEVAEVLSGCRGSLTFALHLCFHTLVSSAGCFTHTHTRCTVCCNSHLKRPARAFQVGISSHAARVTPSAISAKKQQNKKKKKKKVLQWNFQWSWRVSLSFSFRLIRHRKTFSKIGKKETFRPRLHH